MLGDVRVVSCTCYACYFSINFSNMKSYNYCSYSVHYMTFDYLQRFLREITPSTYNLAYSKLIQPTITQKIDFTISTKGRIISLSLLNRWSLANIVKILHNHQRRLFIYQTQVRISHEIVCRQGHYYNQWPTN